jgi:D-alanyl-D-alanine carboxypeptidase
MQSPARPTIRPRTHPLIRPRRAVIFVLAALLLCFTAAAGAAGARPAALGPVGQGNLRTVLDEQMAVYNVPGAIVGMWFPGIGTWVAGAGVADLSTGEAPLPTDQVRIGSITKSFTATCVLELVDARKLALTDALSKYVPWVPNAGHITVRRLLNMTSGLYNFTDDQTFWDKVLADRMALWTPRQLVKLAVSHPAVFPPGQRYMYCNTNYVLLGMIIEKVTGNPASHEITTRIIDRLGLKHTFFPMGHGLPAPYMHGYAPVDGQPTGSAELQDFSIYSPTPFWTAGGMVSTVGDLKIWLKAIATGKLLSARMHAAQLKFSAPNTSSYGLGVMNASGTMFGHSGEVPGYNSSMYYSPRLKATSIVLINRYPSSIEGAADIINGALIRAMMDAPPPTAP